jgi:hypothetical protein
MSTNLRGFSTPDGTDRRPQSQQVAVHTKTGDLALGDGCDDRVVAKFLAGVDVGHVHLDDGALEDGQRVADAVAVVRPGAGVDQHGGGAVAVGAVDALGHFAFDVGLKALDIGAQFLAQCDQACVDFRQGGGAVLRRVALAEHVEVDAVQGQDLHGWGRGVKALLTPIVGDLGQDQGC